MRQYDDMRRPVLGDIGVKIDANQPWADGFLKALSFLNTVLVANFHEETNLSACAIRIINGGHDILNKGIVARSQLTGRDNFRGKIAVSTGAATAMSSDEMYGVAVHEMGHMLGLKHNDSSRSVMYFINVNGSEILDSKDILDLTLHHKLCANSGASGTDLSACSSSCPRQSEISDPQLAVSSQRRLDASAQIMVSCIRDVVLAPPTSILSWRLGSPSTRIWRMR